MIKLAILEKITIALAHISGFFGDLIQDNNYLAIAVIFALCALTGTIIGKITKPLHK